MSERVSVVINTCCLGEKARSVIALKSGIRYGERLSLLRDVLLPRLINDPLVDEVIVVGEYEPGDGYTYVECPSVAFDCTDALAQRQAGFEASHGDIVVFLHDDHLPLGDFFSSFPLSHIGWDVLVPERLALSNPPNGMCVLNNGREGGYVMGHACVMRRVAVKAVPWSSVAKVHTWDVDHSRKLLAAGQRIVFEEDVNGLAVEDMEARIGARPWM